MRHDVDHLVTQWGLPLFLALIAVSVRMLFSVDRVTFLGLCRGILVGIFVGSLANMYLVGIPTISDESRGALVGVAAILAEDLIIFLLRLGRRLRDDPDAILRFLFRIRK